MHPLMLHPGSVYLLTCQPSHRVDTLPKQFPSCIGLSWKLLGTASMVARKSSLSWAWPFYWPLSPRGRSFCHMEIRLPCLLMCVICFISHLMDCNLVCSWMPAHRSALQCDWAVTLIPCYYYLSTPCRWGSGLISWDQLDMLGKTREMTAVIRSDGGEMIQL